MPVRRSAKTPTVASYEFFFKKLPVSAKNQRNIVLTRPVDTALSFKPKKETYLPLPGSLRIG